MHALLEAEGLTPKQVYGEMGVKHSTFSRWLNATYAPMTDTQRRIAEALSKLTGRDVTVNELMRGVSDPPRPRKSRQGSSVSETTASVTGRTSSVTLPRHASALGEADEKAKKEAGLIVKHWGFAERLLNSVPEDRREEAYAAVVIQVTEAIQSFNRGAAKPARRAAHSAVAHKRGA